MTNAEIIALIAENLPSGQEGFISATKLREVVTAIAEMDLENILTNAETTGGKDIILTDGGSITSENGTSEIQIDDTRAIMNAFSEETTDTSKVQVMANIVAISSQETDAQLFSSIFVRKGGVQTRTDNEETGAFTQISQTPEQIEVTGKMVLPANVGVAGTPGRIFYQNSSNALAQSPNLFWDETNSRFSVGQGNSPGASVDIKSPGTAATDLALRVRNSANTQTLLQCAGNGDMTVNGHLGLNTSASSNTTLRMSDGSAYGFAIDIEKGGADSYGQRIVNYGSGAAVGLLLNVYGGTTNTALAIASGDISLSNATGTKIGSQASQKMAFWGATPQAQPVLPTGSSVDDVITFLQSIGLCRQS